MDARRRCCSAASAPRFTRADLDEAGALGVARKVEAAGGRAVAHSVDVSDASTVEALAERVYAAEGATDILHNNTGVGHAGRIEETTLEEWRRVLGVNLMGVVHGVHSFGCWARVARRTS